MGRYPGERNGYPLQYSGLDNSRDYRAGRRRQWHPTPVLLPGKSHGRRSPVGCSPWGREESDTTERLPFYFSLSCVVEGNGNPLQCSCLENPRDGRAWWAAVCGVARSRTRLKRLSRRFLRAVVQLLSHIRLFCDPMDCTRQAPLSIDFSRQEYWSGCRFLLQGIFPTQGSNTRLLHWQVSSLPLSHQGSRFKGESCNVHIRIYFKLLK